MAAISNIFTGRRGLNSSMSMQGPYMHVYTISDFRDELRAYEDCPQTFMMKPMTMTHHRQFLTT